MGLASKHISKQEEFAVFAVVYGYCTDWREAYATAMGSTVDKLKIDANLSSYVSHWKSSAKIATLYNKLRDEKAIKENELFKTWEKQRGDSVRKETKSEVPAIDYSDPANRRKLYNEVIAAATDDPKTQLDAAKMFEQIQRDDRQAASEQKQVRAYLPITCDSCPLYQRARKKL